MLLHETDCTHRKVCKVGKWSIKRFVADANRHCRYEGGDLHESRGSFRPLELLLAACCEAFVKSTTFSAEDQVKMAGSGCSACNYGEGCVAYRVKRQDYHQRGNSNFGKIASLRSDSKTDRKCRHYQQCHHQRVNRRAVPVNSCKHMKEALELRACSQDRKSVV